MPGKQRDDGLVPDSCEFTDDLEKDFVIVQALKAAIKAKPGVTILMIMQ